MRVRACSAIALTLAWYGLASLVHAASAARSQPIPIDTMLQMKQISQLKLSPTGEWLAYVVRREKAPPPGEDWPHGRAESKMHIVNLRSGATVDTGEEDSWNPSWSPSGRKLMYFSVRDGKVRLWIWETGSPQPRVLQTSRPLQVASDFITRNHVLGATTFEDGVFQWSADESRLLGKYALSAPAHVDDRRPLFRVFDTPARTAAPPAPTTTGNGIESGLGMIDLSSGEVTPVRTIASPMGAVLSPDGRYVAYWISAGTDPEQEQQPLATLVVHTLPSGENRIRVSGIPAYGGGAVSWSNDSSKLLYTTVDVLDGQLPRGDVYIVDRDSGSPKNLTPSDHPPFGNPSFNPFWEADGSAAYFLPYYYASYRGTRPRTDSVWKVNLADGEVTQLVKLPGAEALGFVGTVTNKRYSVDRRNGGLLLLVRDDETKNTRLLKVNPDTGAYTQVFDVPRNIGNVHAFGSDIHGEIQQSHDGRIVAYVSQEASVPPDVWVAGRDMRNEKRLTRLNPELEAYRMGRVQLLRWFDAHGRVQRGALLLPSNYRPGERYPLIVNMYPGSEWSNHAHTFGVNTLSSVTDNLQMYVTRGYAVLVADATWDKKTPTSSLVDSVLPGINKAIEVGVADPDRIGAMGLSGSGYATVALISHSPRFAAAVVRAPGNLNFFSMAGILEDNGGNMYGFLSEGHLQGSIWEAKQRYLEQSPLFHIDRTRAAVLVLSGTADYCCYRQSDELYAGLKRTGKIAQYVRYENEPHGEAIWRYENQRDYWERALGWFEQYLKPRQVPVPRAVLRN